MNSRYWALARAIRGPIMLIVVGCLFVFDRMDVVPFSRGWPVLIIVFGVLKLIERSIAPPLPYVPPGAYPQQPVPAPPLQAGYQQSPGGTQPGGTQR